MSQELREQKLAGGVWILEQLVEERPGVERSGARRVLREIMRAWPGDVHRLWWKWFEEAGRSLDLHCRTLDCTVEEAVSLAQEGVQLIIYQEQSPALWLLLGKTSRNKFSYKYFTDAEHEQRVSERKLRKRLENLTQHERIIRVVAFEADPMSRQGLNAGKWTPLSRLYQLLKPEWSDLWIVLVYGFAVGLFMLATPIAVESLVNTVAFGRVLQPIIVLSMLLLMFLGLLAAVRALQTYVVEIIQRRLFARIACDLAYRLPRTTASATDGQHAPELVNRFFDVVTVQKVTAQLLLDGIGLILSALIGMAVLAFYHPWLLGMDLLLLASIAFMVLVLGRGAVGSAIKESKHKYSMAAWLEDIASSPATFRNDGGPDLAIERADRIVHNYLDARRSHFNVLMRQIIFVLALQALASTTLLGLGGWLVISGELTLGQLVAAELIVTTVVGAFAKFGKHIESFYDLLASVDKLGVLFDLETEEVDGMLWTGHDQALTVLLNSVNLGKKTSSPFLRNLSVSVAPGESLAIYGPSGSGKSTLLELLFGLRHQTSGQVLIEGYDPRDLRPDLLRSRVALVRGCEVFHGTIDENVHLHRAGVSSADVRDVLEGLGILDDALELPDGCQTKLSSSGSPLTENEIRLLGIARAVVGRPGLLLIDGVLDSLSDSEVETVLDYILSPEQPWTFIVATGRDSIARRCSQRLDLPSTPRSASSSL